MRLQDDGDPDRRSVRFRFNDEDVMGFEDEPVAVALLASGIRTIRRQQRSGLGRGIYCGIGHCYDCVATVDGAPGKRTCLTPLREGMEVRS